MSTINSRLRVVGVGVAALVVALFAQLNYLQVFDASSLDHNPLNTRDIIAEYEQPRGAIISADGVTLAQSVPAKTSTSTSAIPRGPTLRPGNRLFFLHVRHRRARTPSTTQC